MYELQFIGEIELEENEWLNLATETDKLIESILNELEDDHVDIVRLYAMKAHVTVLRASRFIEAKEYDEARQILAAAETMLEPYSDHVDAIYVYIEVLLGKGRAYYSEELFTLALNYFRKAEYAHEEYTGIAKNMIELFGLEQYVKIATNKKAQEKWSLQSLNRLLLVSLFTYYVKKNNNNAALNYAIPSLVAKVELAYVNGEKCTALEVATKILDLVDIFISNRYFQQADHLLSVAAYNLDKERNYAGKNELKLRELDKLHGIICNRYAWLGYLLLKGSMQYRELKEKESYGVPANSGEMRKLEIHASCVRLTQLVGEGFAPYENQMPHQYITEPEEVKEVVDTTKSWIREGHRLAETQEERTKFICIMEDVLDIERKMKKTMAASTVTSTSVLQTNRIVKFK